MPVDAFKEFPHLLAPFRVGDVVYRNHMFCAPTGHTDDIAPGQPSTDGLMSFERIAMGGAATVAEGEVIIDHTEFSRDKWPRDIVNRQNYNYARMADVVKRHGAVPTMELCFTGSGPSKPSIGIYRASGRPLEGPCDMEKNQDGLPVKAMTEERILEVIRDFGIGAMAAKQAGFPMVSIHAAHSRAFQHWFSPQENRRTDKWGGDSAENRCRFAVMAIDEIHRVCGRGFPVEIRISGTEIVPDGYGIDEGCRIAEQLDGHADIISVSVSAMDTMHPESFSRTHLSMFYEPGHHADVSAEIKKHVKKSLVGIAGGFSDPYLMEKVLAEGKADIINMARQLNCDPDLPNKVRAGRPEDIRRCMRCLTCFSQTVSHGDMLCALNPEAQRNREVYYSLPKAAKRRTLVIGGGIAGMEAAVTAAENGHEVILCEKSGELGGTILCERDVSFKEALHGYIEQQKRKIARLPIDLRLNTPVTHDYAAALKPDAVICAIGSDVAKPPIPGLELPHVHSAVEVFNDPSLAGGKVLILGAGLAGTELSIHLALLGKESEIVEMGFMLNDGGNSCHGRAVLDMLIQHEIPVHYRTKALEITAEGVRCQGPEGEVFYPADTVIYAAGMKARTEEALSFYDVAPIFHIVGDCKQSSTILNATGTAYTAAKYLGRYD
ncbi:MAG: FAD-dependent oxidoreductase [Oscillospiraceae bacterium]|nr:FAD-dependent oxidoreductase [Oscillospiraceae bacterium]